MKEEQEEKGGGEGGGGGGGCTSLLPRSRAGPASSAVAWRRCGPRVLALVAAIPPIPLQALVAALKLITSSVWFFSHALIAARKREDVQSYTEASHSTRRCHANSYFPPSSQH